MAGEQEPGVLVGDRERVAVHTVSRAELPFEVGGPQVIRVARDDRHHAGMLMRPATRPLMHQAATREQIRDGTRRRPILHRWMPGREDLEQLPRAPEGMLAPKLAELLRPGLGDTMWTVMRRATPIPEAALSFLRVAFGIDPIQWTREC